MIVRAKCAENADILESNECHDVQQNDTVDFEVELLWSAENRECPPSAKAR